MQAYPAHLFSDELGVESSGIAVNAIPMGIYTGKPIVSPASGMAAANAKSALILSGAGANGSYSATSVNPAWYWNYALNFTSASSDISNGIGVYPFGGLTCVKQVVAPCPGPTTTSTAYNATWTGISYFNGLGVNPKGYGSAVQTFDNPQALTRTANGPSGSDSTLTCADVADVNTSNNGVSGLTTLFNGVNQAPNGGTPPWSGVSPGDVLYMANDDGSHVDMRATGDVNGKVGAYLQTYGCFGGTTTIGSLTSGGSLDAIPTTDHPFAVLTQRPWWTGAAGAATYTPYGLPVVS